MRHVWSLLVGLAVAPVAYFMFSLDLTYAQVRYAAPDGSELVIAQLVLAGLILGALGSTRLSPTGPIAAGLLLLFPIVLGQILPAVFDLIFPQDRRIAIGEVVRFVPAQGATNGFAAVTGVMLLMAAASPGRWKRWPKPTPAAGAVEPVVDTGRIDAVAAWRPFPDDSSEATVALDIPQVPKPATTTELPLTGPWAPPPPPHR
jgi:hypothetical protein